MRLKPRERKVLLTIVVFIITLTYISPFIHLFLSSIKLPKDVYDPSNIIPTEITFNNYLTLFSPEFAKDQTWYLPQYLMNSVIISLSTTFLVILIAVFAAYGFARYRFKLSVYLFFAILLMYMIPSIVLAIPITVFFIKLGLFNTRLAVILALTARLLPFAIWVLTAFFNEIPRELEEAAKVDGCNRIEVLYRVVLPLSGPGIAVTSIYSFIFAWSDFLFSLCLISSPSKYVLPLGITFFIGEQGVDWGLLTASGVIAVIPNIIFAAILQKYIVKGLVFGRGVKISY